MYFFSQASQTKTCIHIFICVSVRWYGTYVEVTCHIRNLRFMMFSVILLEQFITAAISCKMIERSFLSISPSSGARRFQRFAIFEVQGGLFKTQLKTYIYNKC